MGNLLNFAVYNPAILSDEDFLAGFIARQSLAESLLQGLRRIEPDGLAKHRLIIGQRGMGKTSLLRRLALGVAQDAELSARFLPLTFREEQYNVHNFRTFWNNCLDALGDCFERAGQVEQAEGVDRDIANLERTTDADGEAACRIFKDWCKRENKRPLLLLDNIDIILDGLTKQDWAFRRVLQERGGAVVFGATVNPLEATAKIEAAFYDFFQVTVLEKLSFPELMSCLRQLANMRGEDGQKVRRVLDRDQARIHTLYDFTGGNPRTLVLLYLLLELDPEEDVMSDLERLLDQVSVLYKARVEDLAPQARVVLDAVALNWNPAAIARIKEITGLETGSIAAQLDRLQKNGVIEKTALSTAGSSGYQLGERLFNIWYLMRHGQRRQRNRLRWLSECLRGLYGPDQLRDMARGMVSRPNRSGLSGGQYSLAMREAVDEPVLQRLLEYHATCEFERHAEETRTAIQQFIDLEDLDGETHTMAELKKTVLNCQREWPEGITAEEFWELLGGSLRLSQREKSQFVQQLLTKMPDSAFQTLIKVLASEISEWNEQTGLPEVVAKLRMAVCQGLVHHLHDILGIAAAIQRGDDPRILLLVVDDKVQNEIGTLLDEELQYALQSIMFQFSEDINIQASSLIWFNYAELLVLAGNYNAAEQAYLKAAELNPNNSAPWNNLGNLLNINLNRYEEAERAYRQAIERDPENVVSWYNLGNLLQDHLQRYEEAESAYREAIKQDTDNAIPCRGLGLLLQYHLYHFEEAEQAYREAIKRNSEYADPWNDLGNLFADFFGKQDEAKQAYQQCLSLDPENFSASANLAYLLFDQPKRIEEAEVYYQQATEKLPAHGGGLLRAYRAFTLDNIGDGINAFAEAINSNADELFINHFDDMLRVLKLAEQRGYGEKLLAWFDESGVGERYWPLRAAFEAYVYGEAKLRDVNPEVRAAASRIYDSLDRLRKGRAGAVKK
ncbi:MAG: tetratricopeptide repeat protein [Candidatus Methylumidiphilus sp.]